MTSCSTKSGKLCPTGGSSNPCEPFQLSNGQDDCVIDELVTESLLIGAAPMNVYKLLGIHAQSNLQDTTGFGRGISAGAINGFAAQNAFLVTGRYRSSQRGPDVVATAWLGYDFGEIKRSDGQPKYGSETFINKNISSFSIAQSECEERRASKVRLERSSDGKKWFGVDVVDLPNTATAQFISVRSSVPSRFWRIRPIAFAGGTQDFWEVARLQFSEYEAPNLKTIQDKILMENRDRDYDETALPIKGKYEHMESVMELTPHGMTLSDQLVAEVSFTQCIQVLGRPIVTGDLIELPAEVMYTPDMKPVKKYMEVTDVAWSGNGYTPGWKPTLLRITMQMAVASQETRDILGPLASKKIDPSGQFDVEDGENTNKPYQDYSEVLQTIRAEAHTQVPVDGISQDKIDSIDPKILEYAEKEGLGNNVAKIQKPSTGLYIEDGLPPNGESYTESTELPQSGKDGDYHRVVYTGLAKDIPPRLYRYSAAKRSWIYLETDRRYKHRHTNSLSHTVIKNDPPVV